MKTFRIDYNKMNKELNYPETAMAVGYFDGIHLGHQAVIGQAKQIADRHGYESAVMTFDPHPSVVLGKAKSEQEHITPIEDKIEIIKGLGIDRLYIVTFSREFASLTPQQFVDLFVIGFNVKHVVAGFDFSFGKKGEGTMETLPFHSRGRFEHTTIPKVAINGEKVSSTLIRQLIRNGSVDEIPTYLGRPYRIKGTVIHGEERGRTIGFPTANIEREHTYLLPSTGVYAVRMHVKDAWYEGVCNIGYKPTFHDVNDGAPSVEVHLFSFDESIYGEEVVVEWCRRIRSEQKFTSVEELKQQISIDRDTAKSYFHNSSV